MSLLSFTVTFSQSVGLSDILDKVVVQVRGKSPPEVRDPPFLVAQNPIVFSPASLSTSADVVAKPCPISVEYNGPSAGRTSREEVVQEVEALSVAFPASLGGEVVALPPEVVHQEVVEQEVIVGGDTPLNDVMPAVETFNVDEIPRAEELVEIVDEQGQLQEEEVQSSPVGDRRAPELAQLPPTSPLMGQDPLLQTASLLPPHSFLQQLLGYYSKPPPDTFQLWADEETPTDMLPRTDTNPYLTTFTTQTEVESPGTAILNSSLPSDQPSAYICPECRLCFSLLHQFQDHLLTHPDPPDKRFLCQYCGKRFLRADHLNRHTQLHKEVKVFKCRRCGEEFPRASHLDKHRRKVHATPSASTPGAKRTSSASGKPAEGSNLHLLAAVASPEGRGSRGGTGTTPPIADIVLQSCSVPVAQVEETVIAEDSYEEDYEEESGYPLSAEPDRPFSCDKCGRKFIRITHMRRHMRIHTGERPFLCHICGRRYARGDYLRAHIQAHRKERMHKCKVCGEVFLDLVRFSEHCRSHSVEEFELADMRSERKVASAPEVYQPTSKEMAAVIDGDLGEIVSMVTIPTSEEVVISNDMSPIVSLTTELPGNSLTLPAASSVLDPPPSSSNSAVRSLLQDASRNVHFQEALLSLGEWVGQE